MLNMTPQKWQSAGLTRIHLNKKNSKTEDGMFTRDKIDASVIKL